jgi:hypothetical protein
MDRVSIAALLPRSCTNKGRFENGIAHGKEERHLSDGDWLDGTWVGGEMRGAFTYHHADGTIEQQQQEWADSKSYTGETDTRRPTCKVDRTGEGNRLDRLATDRCMITAFEGQWEHGILTGKEMARVGDGGVGSTRWVRFENESREMCGVTDLLPTPSDGLFAR